MKDKKILPLALMFLFLLSSATSVYAHPAHDHTSLDVMNHITYHESEYLNGPHDAAWQESLTEHVLALYLKEISGLESARLMGSGLRQWLIQTLTTDRRMPPAALSLAF